MPKCSICSSDQRLRIDSDLVRGESERTVAERYSLSKSAVGRHKRVCIAAKMRRAAQRADLDADHILGDLLALRAAAVRLLQKAEAKESFAGAASCVREAHALTVTLGKMIGALDPEPASQTQVNVLSVGGDWLAIRQRVMDALAPFPEARAAVAAALVGGPAALPGGDVIDAEAEQVDG